jgi:hypothetical protein
VGNALKSRSRELLAESESSSQQLGRQEGEEEKEKHFFPF